ncbi:RedY protein [Streptomyces sp. p1417]|uniref:RedY protein n=1 Tax=Streptomyces typhae TaxID=2681492 RepID=A0A6L6WS78_9ACTN|nr:RedY protein [Streptomyces typhae]MVO85122.1 RedY protein [Streptomyces typhae]
MSSSAPEHSSAASTVIVHRIRLREGVTPERFESWVRDVDYATCPRLPGVVAFTVLRVPAAEAAAPGEYFEIIEVTGREAFERDMQSEPFRRLVADFEKMAVVVAESTGDRVGSGYRSH